MAGWTGLEPATFCVTGRRSNQLSYHPGEPGKSSKVESPKAESSTTAEESAAPVSLPVERDHLIRLQDQAAVDRAAMGGVADISLVTS